VLQLTRHTGAGKTGRASGAHSPPPQSGAQMTTDPSSPQDAISLAPPDPPRPPGHHATSRTQPPPWPPESSASLVHSPSTAATPGAASCSRLPLLNAAGMDEDTTIAAGSCESLRVSPPSLPLRALPAKETAAVTAGHSPN